jgi:hypothetical protein
MILIDSSVWIDYFNGADTRQTDALDLLIDREIVLVGDLILVEVLQGFKSDHDFNIAKKLFNNLLQVELGGFGVAQQSVINYRLLRKKGISIRKTIDVTIATYCIQENIRLLHNDKDFEPLVKYCGLKIF